MATKSKPRKKAEKPSGATIRVKLVKSMIGSSPRQRAVLNGLGLRRVNQIVERVDTPEVRGMVAKVAHLVALEEGA